MDYYSFISSFDVPKDQQGSIMSDIKQSGNHKVYQHRGDNCGMTADEAEKKLRSKLRENFAVSFIYYTNILYYTVIYYYIYYYIMLHACIILYCTELHINTLYFSVLHCIIL